MTDGGESGSSNESGLQVGADPDARQLRVFLSSTFRDMKAERDYLVKFVFPELRALCESRGVTWGEVDLRWGITDEQKAEGKVLPVCLAEIKNCRPYFIGLLGERYGWVPEELPSDLIAAEPWLASHQGRSVTELEIWQGVLNDPAMSGHAFFYFRDPSCVQGKPELQEGVDPAEEERLGRAEAERRAEARRRKLHALKENIRSAHKARALAHVPRENYKTAEAFGDLVREDLRAVIDQVFPEGSAPDALAREAAEHAAFSRSRARVYVARQKDFDALDAHAAGKAQPLVVLGESGSGKSALLANWARSLRARVAADPAAPFILEHYVGASASSTDWAAMLRRILGELDRRFDLKLEPPPNEPQALRMAFANGLYRAAASGRVVLVIDGLNQLEDRDRARELAWLPPELPDNVRVLLSTLPGPSLDELVRRGWPSLNVERLSEAERGALIPKYLWQYRKELSPERVKRLAQAEPTASPLYLRALLEELRLWGEHETLDARIAHYLAAPDARSLYGRIFERWKNDYKDGDNDSLAGRLLSFLYCARRGLSAPELRDLLSRDGEPMPQAVLSPLLLAAGDVLINRSGLLGLGHDHAREAVRDSYLSAAGSEREFREQLAAYFETRPLGPRKVDELPWQLARAEAWKKLYTLLSDLPFFAAAWNAQPFEVKAYWAQIEERSELRITDAYAAVVRGEVGTEAGQSEAGLLLQDAGHLDDALAIFSRMAERFRAIGDLGNMAANLGNMAIVRHHRGQSAQAMALLKEEESVWRQNGHFRGFAMCLGNQAMILKARGEHDIAMVQTMEAERIFRQLGDMHGVQSALGNRALLLLDRGELDQAMTLLKEQELLCKQVGDPDGLSKCLGNQGLIFAKRGQADEAMARHKESERLARRLGDLDGLSSCLSNQAEILHARGKLNEALSLLKEAERLARQMGRPESLATYLGNQALILGALGQIDETMVLHEERERIFRELDNLDGLSKSLHNQAAILKARGRLDEAMRLYKEMERIFSQLRNPQGLAISLANQALVGLDQGQPRAALQSAEAALRIAHDQKLLALEREIAGIVDRIRARLT